MLLAVAAGVLAGIITVIGSGHVQVGWVMMAVAAAFVVLFARGQLRRLQTTYAITSRRLTIETGIFSRDLHQTRLERVQNVNATQSLRGADPARRDRGPSTPPVRLSLTSRFRGVEHPPARSCARSTVHCRDLRG